MQKAGIEVIPKYEIKYPEYSVITPHTNHEYTVRALKVSEEEAMKASLLTPNKLTQHLNQVLFSSLVKKPAEINTYQDFLTKNTMRDRDALMYGLYHVTYKDIHNYDVECNKCGHVNSVKVKFGEAFSMKGWAGEDNLLDKEVEVKLETAEAITVIVRQPTLADEEKLLSELTFSSEEERDKQMDLLAIKRIEIEIKEDVKNNDQIMDRSNIRKIYDDLPATDRRLIDDAYAEHFGKYGVELTTVVRCESCQSENETEIDLVRQFFRSIYE